MADEGVARLVLLVVHCGWAIGKPAGTLIFEVAVLAPGWDVALVLVLA